MSGSEQATQDLNPPVHLRFITSYHTASYGPQALAEGHDLAELALDDSSSSSSSSGSDSDGHAEAEGEAREGAGGIGREVAEGGPAGEVGHIVRQTQQVAGIFVMGIKLSGSHFYTTHLVQWRLCQGGHCSANHLWCF